MDFGKILLRRYWLVRRSRLYWDGNFRFRKEMEYKEEPVECAFTWRVAVGRSIEIYRSS